MSENENRISLGKEYLEEGRNALYDNKLDEAALLVQSAIDLFKEAEDIRNHANSLNLMGVIYASLGNESMAIDYYLEGLSLIGEGDYDDIRILFYNNIGSRYHDLKDYHKGLNYFLMSEELLDSETVKNNPRYPIWCMVSYLNVFSSYLALGQYDKCSEYIDKLDAYEKYDDNSLYTFGYHVCKYLLFFRTDKKDFVRNNIDILLREAVEDKNVFDQVQNFTDMCTLLREMGEYNRWYKAISNFESRAKAINNNYLLLFCSQLWMEYFKAVDDEKSYNQMCIRHAELYFKQKEIDTRDRIASIDIKIALQEKEMERKLALKKSNTDALTGLGNRNALSDDLDEVLKEAAKNDYDIGIGVLDIDCFKQENDTYGHIEGDRCLIAVSDILKSLNNTARSYRFGGDEFVVLFPKADDEIIKSYAVNIQNRLKELNIDNVNSLVSDKLTISQGYVLIDHKLVKSCSQLVKYADTALYKVKQSGR
ncbi:MAG: GGDEF domain-containing protein, partial [Erysipelotrichaceae bacterium]